MNSVKQIINTIQRGDIKPVYFLTGTEPYYIDLIANYIEKQVLKEEEKGFNQLICYGRDVTVDDIISYAKRYPMMAERQVIIVKEAQDLAKTIEKLAAYVEHPQPTTLLVICYKYKTLDKRKKTYKALQKNSVIYESKTLYENQVAPWIKEVLSDRKHTISHKACEMLMECIGTDLSKINNALEKLQLIIPQAQEITPEVIEEYIGISKDYNNFELKKAIGDRDMGKAARIIHYFAQNPKENPLVVTISLLYTFFSQLLQFHSLKDRSAKNIATTLGINAYFIKEYQIAAKNYPMKKASRIISHLRTIDLKSKGVGANALPQSELLKELLITVMA